MHELSSDFRWNKALDLRLHFVGSAVSDEMYEANMMTLMAVYYL